MKRAIGILVAGALLPACDWNFLTSTNYNENRNQITQPTPTPTPTPVPPCAPVGAPCLANGDCCGATIGQTGACVPDAAGNHFCQ